MVEISMSGSGEGPVWVTGRGYSTVCAPGMARSARDGAVNRGAKANREVTRRCKSSGGLGGRNP
jgi:hypothetical protein